jgi:hypothetical protein
MDEKIFLILFEKGILATVLLIFGFLLNAILQANKLRGETVAKLAENRASAYEKLWKGLALIRPADDEEVSHEKRKQVEKLLADWYHDDSGALYMSWLTARRYMLLRRALDNKDSSSKMIRNQISLLRTRLKIDCGIYSCFEGMMQLPSRKSANKSFKQMPKSGAA